jgi:hypothetical protein
MGGATREGEGCLCIESAAIAELDVRLAKVGTTGIEELLGLIAMWELRGDNWRIKPGETKILLTWPTWRPRLVPRQPIRGWRIASHRSSISQTWNLC